jgi:hypothetical protein
MRFLRHAGPARIAHEIIEPRENAAASRNPGPVVSTARRSFDPEKASLIHGQGFFRRIVKRGNTFLASDLRPNRTFRRFFH